MNDVVESFLTADAIKNYAKNVDPVGNSQVVDRLSGLAAAALFSDPVTNDKMADCCLSGLWLLHNHLHRSHDISQSISAPEGSWWHAIMHRTEGDFSNAKYWYRRAGEHPVLRELQKNQLDFRPGFLRRSVPIRVSKRTAWKGLAFGGNAAIGVC